MASLHDLTLKPVGFISSEQKEPYQAARQPDELSLPAKIKIEGPYAQALKDLEGCSHIWLIFGFHHNPNWKPLIQTPRSDRKIGVFATRAPYRPNPLGLTAVPLISVQGLILEIGPNDLLDGTPIYDIKPYLDESDKIENTNVAWLENAVHPRMTVNFSPVAEEDIGFLETHGLRDIRPFILRQLEYDPLNSAKKRVEVKDSIATLSYRTWRIDFIVSDQTIGILAIRSGYTESELADDTDTYQDKVLHKKFIRHQQGAS